jgi:hypothetical protein
MTLATALRAGTFFIAIFAALVALQLYNLLKAGEIAQTWKSFIIGALVLAVWSLADFADAFFANLFDDSARMKLVLEILRTAFVLLFAGGLWRQRQTYFHPDRYRPPEPGSDGVDVDMDLDREFDDPPRPPVGRLEEDESDELE